MTLSKEIKALRIASAAMLLALGFVSVFGYVLRQRALAGSHEQPSTDSWFAFAPVTTPDDVVAGRKLFLGNCASCHAPDAHGDEGPDLYDLQISDRRIATVIKKGIKGEMPSFARKINDAQIVQLRAYLRSLND
jgi:mono/diheme cytochrome c family protein